MVLEVAPTKMLPDTAKDLPGDLAAPLAEEMHRRWESGERPRAEEFLESHPEVAKSTEAALRLIYEEYCLRQESGEAPAVEEYLRRFPQWRQQLSALLDCHHLLLPAPMAADEIRRQAECDGEFILKGELGRGSQGQVFLAVQPRLGNRPVVLKVTPVQGDEPHALARLQHTHVVPLFGLQETEEKRVLCMPYLGGATLEDLFQELRTLPPHQRNGRHVVDALDRLQAASPLVVPPRGRIRHYLAGLHFAEAMCWFGTCLAEALDFAHQRNLVHLDIKPSNILITSDGLPMLLDFHISQQPLRLGGPRPTCIGGTPKYAAPEQWAAIQAITYQQPLPGPVDGRADIYSLGMVLYQGLGGDLPLQEEGAFQPLPKVNSQVTPGLGDIVARCLQAKPEQRYPSGQALADDLRRHLSHLPLQGVANRSWSERWRKWRRRQPQALRLAVMALAVCGAVLGFLLIALDNKRHGLRQAEYAHKQGQSHFDQGQFALAAAELERGLQIGAGGSMGDELRQSMSNLLNQARTAQEAQQLHFLVERLRFHHGAPTPSGITHELDVRFQQVWDRRARLLSHALPARLEPQVKADLKDLGLLWVDLRLGGAGRDPGGYHVATWQLLEEMRLLCGDHWSLSRQRQMCATILGKVHDLRDADAALARLKPGTFEDLFAQGRLLLAQDDLAAAQEVLDRAVAMQPQAFWPNYYQAACAYRQQRWEEADSALRVCLALAPHSSQVHYNRGMVYLARQQPQKAAAAFRRALELDPTGTDAQQRLAQLAP